jgi:ABC-type enterobactin transport system permease subunit
MGFPMQALSGLATLVSVICFPLAFLALLYPHVASQFGRWRGFLLYFGLFLGTLLLAAWSAPDSETSLTGWSWNDWAVASVAGGGSVGYLIVKYRRKSAKTDPEESVQLGPKKVRSRRKRSHP